MNVTVKKTELVEKIKKAKDEHVKQYEEALRGWIDQMQDAAKRVIDRSEKGLLRAFPKEFHNLMQMPSLHIDDFDQALKMLEMSVDDEIMLEPDDFNQLVLGNWAWKERWVATNAMYSGVV